MSNLSGQLLMVYVLAALLAALGGAALARRYRSALLRLMQAPLATRPAPADGMDLTLGVAEATNALPSWTAPAPVTLASHRAAQWRLVAWLAALSLLIALTRSVIWIQMSQADLSVPRVLTLGFAYAWPMLPAFGLMWRWSWGRLLAALLGWYLASVAIVMLRSVDGQSLAAVAQVLAWDIGLPTLTLMLLTLRRTRASAPWLWPPLALLLLAALLGLEALSALVFSDSAAVAALAGSLGAGGTLALFTLGAAALAWWPVRRFARWLAQAYAAKRVSDLIVIFGAAWALNLAFDALGSGPLVLLPLLWIPLLLWLARGWQRRHPQRAPTLLVLRVFKQAARAQAVFDDVVERWRVSGNTVLIAGTDLVDQTLDATDVFDFLDGRLAARFVNQPADLPARLADFDWLPDADGRWRVNECYCHDSSWQVALAALAERADLVLMDLRGFAAHNAGCRFELGVLAQATHLQRAVLLTDASTDLATARAAAAGASADRFVWLALPDSRRRARRAARTRVLAALLGQPDALRSPAAALST